MFITILKIEVTTVEKRGINNKINNYYSQQATTSLKADLKRDE